ncbi:hypothetical protein C882_3717 [Caenispirillum salinarum AK4]|uniref:Lysophospholipase n=1 Tax=Caenispirillum salinarum AK4 TaxID=1238182 RepID=K9H2Q9_9PROT|nr:DUF1489 domain-containing protein [Caenispirillum salinarum]EKV31344.1 hypothetical protein C882_3717 [Caenispirillum salinarum AK4]
MPLHLIKLSVGTESPETLAQWQAGVSRRLGRIVHTTRMTPRRGGEVLDGGSIYWVIKRLVRVRQRILGLHEGTDEGGRSFCAIELDPELVPVEPRSQRPFQGWRYLKPEDAPRDLPQGAAGEEPPPPEMAAELRKLGLL